MNKDRLVVNTLVYHRKLKQGIPQAELLKPLHDLGVKKVEIRREFIQDKKTEFSTIQKSAKDYSMQLYYSVPSYLYQNGIFMKERQEMFYQEARAMDCRFVKLNIGDYITVTKEDLQTLSSLCERYNILQSIENDQTLENGTLETIHTFLETCKQKGGPISLTFDVGNWIWTNENPIEAANRLHPYVRYIHVKDVRQGTPPSATCLGDGDLDWKSVVKRLPSNVPVALEYPCDDCLPAEIQKLMEANI